MSRLSYLAAAGLIGVLCVPSAASAEPAVVPPLQADGYLWAAPPSPIPASQLKLQLGFNHHAYSPGWLGGEELTFSSVQLLLAGEYTFLDALTVGVDVPFLMVYDISSEREWVEESGVDFGNVRLHIRYAFQLAQLGLVITPTFRVWLPTNTYLNFEVEGFGMRENVEVIDTLAIFEPMLSVGWASQWFSVVLATGPKFAEIDDSDDFSAWGIDLILGSAPVASLPDLQFVLELNMLIEMDDDMLHTGDMDDTGVPLALGLGARYRFGDFAAELALRVGLRHAEIYYGDFGFGLTVGWVFGG